MKRLPFIIGMIVLSISISLIGVQGYLRFTDKNPLTYEQPWILNKSIYIKGESIVFDFTRCNKSNENITYFFTQVFRNLDTNMIYAIPGAENVAEPGCVTIPSVPKKIPEGIPSGRYRFESITIADTKYNTFVQKLHSVEFEIIQSSDSGDIGR